MINRASVQMWGIVGQSAGPPKWAGKKNDCALAHAKWLRFGAHDPILSTQRIPRGRDPIFPTQRIGAAGIRFYLHKRDILKNFPAARASKARNSYKN